MFLPAFHLDCGRQWRTVAAVMQVNLNGRGDAVHRGGAARYQFTATLGAPSADPPFDLITGPLIKDVIPFGPVDAVSRRADTTIKTIVVSVFLS